MMTGIFLLFFQGLLFEYEHIACSKKINHEATKGTKKGKIFIRRESAG